MTNLEKYALYTGLASSALILFSVAALSDPFHFRKNSPTSPEAKPQNTTLTESSTALPSPEISSRLLNAPDVLPALPAGTTSIPDEYILSLIQRVHLMEAAKLSPDKAQWKQAMAAAQKFMEGPCDCEQRNWLSHFIEMGNFALTDSHEQYLESARLMATLGRNDKQAMAISQETK